MVRRASVISITFTLALAAAHSFAPAGKYEGEPVLIGEQPVRSDAGTTLVPGFSDGCTAYLSGPAPKSHPHDENRGQAAGVLRTFFGQDALPTEVRYAIALAPDPRHTNLSLMFDREISIVQQAAQDEGYEFNSSWMPWKTEEPKPLSGLADRQYAADLSDGREACPGVILFRKSPSASQVTAGMPRTTAAQAYAQALVVFVVGEQATGGLNESQWENAIKWLSERPLPQTTGDGILRILGPTFTGSLVSLERDLNTIYAHSANALAIRFPSARIFSGSVSGCSAVHWFQGQLRTDANGHTLDFGTFQENDALHIFRLIEYLRSQQTDPKDVAILSEDETAYAALPGPESNSSSAMHDPCDFAYFRENRPVHLVYPRDISALREAYQKESVFESSSGSLQRGATHPILKAVTVEGTGNDDITDTVPSFSGSNTALGQEAYLYGLVSFFRTHHTRYLVLRCTNPLDFLFLTRFFHRAYPEARIVTVGTDLLFRREIDTTEFRGVLSLATYPLMPPDQHWSRITQDDWETAPHDHLVFDGNLTQGIYIAARYLLQTKTLIARRSREADDPLVLYRTLPTPDYADPFWFSVSDDEIPEFTRPPTWLVAVGRDGYWPLAILRENVDLQRLDQSFSRKRRKISGADAPDAPVSTTIQLRRGANPQHYEQDIDGETSTYRHSLLISIPLPWTLCGILAVALLMYQLWGLYLERKHASDGIFSPFHQASGYSQSFLLSINCALALLPLAELTIVRFVPMDFSRISSSTNKIWWWFGVEGLLLLATLAAFLSRWRKHFRKGLISVTWFLCSLAFFVMLNAVAFTHERSADNDVALFYRMAHLTDGVSPLLPILLLTLGFYLWSWQAMAGNLILGKGSPALPQVAPAGSGLSYLDESATRISQKLGHRILHIASPLCFSPRIIVVPLALIAAAWITFSVDNLPLLSLEGHAFNLVFNFTLLFAFAVTAAEAARLYSTWLFMRKLLQAMSRLRLRRTLAQLRAIPTNSIWSVSGNVRRFQYALFTQQLDAANRLYNMKANTEPQAHARLYWAIRYGEKFAADTEAEIETGSAWDKKILLDGITQGRYMRDVLSNAVAETYNFLTAKWKAEDKSLNFECQPGKAEATEDKSPSIPLSADPDVIAAEEFVCFHYIAFIQNIVARMRTITLSMIFLFVTICFAISFYPFVPRTEITVWMILNLILIGTAVAYVYAGMERDEILSFVANTRPGRLGSEFWLKLSGFLAAPVLGVLTTQFPSITDSVLHWLQPGLDAIK